MAIFETLTFEVLPLCSVLPAACFSLILESRGIPFDVLKLFDMFFAVFVNFALWKLLPMSSNIFDLLSSISVASSADDRPFSPVSF